jgi:hypothetical protein
MAFTVHIGKPSITLTPDSVTTPTLFEVHVTLPYKSPDGKLTRTRHYSTHTTVSNLSLTLSTAYDTLKLLVRNALEANHDDGSGIVFVEDDDVG